MKRSCSSTAPGRRAGSRSSTYLRARLDSRATPTRPSCPASSSTTSISPTSSSNEHQRMLTGGFYAEVTLEYIAALASSRAGSRSGSKRSGRSRCRLAMRSATFVSGRKHFTLEQWRDLLAAQRRLRARAIHAPPAGHPACCGWSRSSSTTTTPSSSDPVARASRTCFSRSRRTPTSSRAARRRSPTCS